MTLKHNGE